MLALAAIISISPLQSFAAFSGSDAGTSPAQFLKLGFGARALGMGDHDRSATGPTAHLKEIAVKAVEFDVHRSLRQLTERGLVDRGQPLRRNRFDHTEHLGLPHRKPADQKVAENACEAATKVFRLHLSLPYQVLIAILSLGVSL